MNGAIDSWTRIWAGRRMLYLPGSSMLGSSREIEGRVNLSPPNVAVYSVKRALLEICESVMTPEWIPSSSDRMSPKGRLKSIDWSIS